MSSPATNNLFTDSAGNRVDFLELVSGQTSNPLNNQYSPSVLYMYVGLLFDTTQTTPSNIGVLYPNLGYINGYNSTAMNQVFLDFLGSSNFTQVTDWKSFIDQWRAFLLTDQNSISQLLPGFTPTPASTGTTDTSTTGAAYSYPLGTNLNSNNATAGFFGSFSDALSSTKTDLAAQGVTIDLPTLFNQAFSQFIQTFQLSSTATNATALNEFLTAWSQYTTVTATITQASANTAPLSDLLSYEGIFKAFFPNASTSDFATSVQNFFANLPSGSNQPQLPSQYLNQWYSQIQSSYLQSQSTTPGSIISPGTQIIATNSYKAYILVEIFYLLVQMINSIQQITAVQTDRLTYLSQFQQAYTLLMAEVPTFTEGDGKPAGISNPSNSNTDNSNPLNARNSLNTTMTADLDNLRSLQSLISDNAKQLQSLLSQDNEAVNEQASLATNFIQMFSSIMQSFFH